MILHSITKLNLLSVEYNYANKHFAVIKVVWQTSCFTFVDLMRKEIKECYSAQSYVVGINHSIVLFLVSELFGKDMLTGPSNLNK
jgi:hypothetical protein